MVLLSDISNFSIGARFLSAVPRAVVEFPSSCAHFPAGLLLLVSLLEDENFVITAESAVGLCRNTLLFTKTGLGIVGKLE